MDPFSATVAGHIRRKRDRHADTMTIPTSPSTVTSARCWCNVSPAPQRRPGVVPTSRHHPCSGRQVAQSVAFSDAGTPPPDPSGSVLTAPGPRLPTPPWLPQYYTDSRKQQGSTLSVYMCAQICSQTKFNPLTAKLFVWNYTPPYLRLCLADAIHNFKMRFTTLSDWQFLR